MRPNWTSDLDFSRMTHICLSREVDDVIKSPLLDRSERTLWDFPAGIPSDNLTFFLKISEIVSDFDVIYLVNLVEFLRQNSKS